MFPALLLPALILQVPIPLLTLRVWVFGPYVAWSATNAIEVWITDTAGNLLTPDLPPRGWLTLSPGSYIVHARGIKQEAIEYVEVP